MIKILRACKDKKSFRIFNNTPFTSSSRKRLKKCVLHETYSSLVSICIPRLSLCVSSVW